jgi:hypothetical protein
MSLGGGGLKAFLPHEIFVKSYPLSSKSLTILGPLGVFTNLRLLVRLSYEPNLPGRQLGMHEWERIEVKGNSPRNPVRRSEL